MWITKRKFDYEIQKIRDEFQAKFDESRFYKEDPNAKHGDFQNAIFMREAIRAIKDHLNLEFKYLEPSETKYQGEIIAVKK